MNQRVLVGLSGGVDSAVTAYLLKEQGYDVTCATMDFHGRIDPDAQKIAEALDLPFRIVDVKKQFEEIVQCYFVSEYLHAHTPNPCIICNPLVKFASLLAIAKEEGFDFIATGHYANVLHLENGRCALKKADFDAKDQTYALYRLTQEELSKLLLPLGKLPKDEVRKIAEKIGLSVSNKSDSEEICFIPDNNHPGFIQEAISKVPFSSIEFNQNVLKKGNFVDASGKVLGKHEGIITYTIGQRKGLGIALGHPVYVTNIDDETNEVTLGENEELFTTSLKCNSLSFMGIDSLGEGESISCVAKIRYGHSGTNCTVMRSGSDELTVTFESPVRAITPGQSAVFYQDNILLFGGIIL